MGQKKLNELGLYDMSGNVYEWCQDRFNSSYYDQCQKQGVVYNPPGPDQYVVHVNRGGGWYDSPQYCRVAFRDSDDPTDRFNDVGFRLVLTLQRKP